MNVEQTSLQGVEFESIKLAASGITQILDEFPSAGISFNQIKGSTTYKNAFAYATYYGDIAINPSYFSNSQNLENTYGNSTKSKFHPEGTTAVHITSHESGHILERALIQKQFSGGSELAKVQAWNDHIIAKKVISEAAKNAKRQPDGKGKKNDDLISEVSTYAKKNRTETLAECVADYAANKDKAKPLSREVWKILKRELG